jgi:hypothetical protein
VIGDTALVRRARLARVFFERRAGAICVLAVLLAAGWAWSVDWGHIGAVLASPPAVRPFDGALHAEARRLGLGYDEVSQDPQAHAGKPVVWCLVEAMSPQGLFVGGNMSRPVEMAGGDFKAMATARMGVCRPTLAVVEGRGERGIALRFAGHP